MPLFQLIIDGEVTRIVIEAPMTSIAEHYISDVGGDGNHLYEILSTIVGGYEKIRFVEIPFLGPDNSLLRFDLYQA